jgi:hypothetical protein
MDEYQTQNFWNKHMKKSELQSIIKEELKAILKESLTADLIDNYYSGNKTGKPALIISKLLTLEKVLQQIKRSKSPGFTTERVVDMVLGTFDEIRKI